MFRNFIKIIVIICFFSHINLNAENSYPLTYQIKNTDEGGKIIPIIRNQTLYNYLIKQSLDGESDVVSLWKGFEKQKVRGNSLGDVNIISSFSNSSYLYIVYEENSQLYIALLDSMINIQNITEIILDNDIGTTYQLSWSSLGEDKILLLINNYLLNITKIEKFIYVKQISNDVQSMSVNQGDRGKSKGFNNIYEFYYLKKYSNLSELLKYNSNNKETLITRLPLSSEVYLQTIDDKIFIISGNKYSANSWVHICSYANKVEKKINIPSHPNLIRVFAKNGSKYINYLLFDNLNYTVILEKINEKNNKENELIYKTSLPEGLIEVKDMYEHSDTTYFLFRNGLVSLSDDGNIISKDYYPFGEFFTDNPDFYVVNNMIYLSTYSMSIIFERKQNSFWFVFQFLDEGGNYFFPILLILLVIIFYRKYHTQKNLSKALLNLPSAGVVFIIDNNGRLLRLNDSGKKMLGITLDVPLRRIFKYYCDEDSTKQLQILVDKVVTLRKGFTERINIFDKNIVKEWFFSVFPLSSEIGKSKGYVITGLDITEELERRRINNLAQLAHDMQTNLSTIRLNAEQLECGENPDNLTRRKKIMHQVTLLIQRVRDIVTVGRSDNPDWQLVDASDICVDVRNEFDDSMFPNVEFNLEIKSFQVKCDKLKLIRALRNAIENGIRALPNTTGKITISNWYDNRFCYFSIKDTGSGMDEQRKKMMMTPYFSTSNKEGGAGIGTLIMQRVIEQHAGELKVISEQGKGTDVVFCIPNIQRSKGL